MIHHSLKQLGLNDKEIRVFLEVFRMGEGSPSMIAKKTKLPRTTVFDTLTKLSKKGLLHRFKKFGQYTFTCEDEDVLMKFALKEQQRWMNNQVIVEKILPLLHNLRSPYSPAPTIRFYEGSVEVSAIYEDILKTGEDILLYRSLFDHDDDQLSALLSQHIPKQVKKGIKVRALTPLTDSTAEHILEIDKKQLMERRVLDPKEFSLPAQIIVYGKKAAIITHKHHVFGTVIEDEDVVQTLKIIFELVWKQAESFHKDFVKKIKKKKTKKKSA
jgi:sugar-specific transcriptional regulator TrmB